MIISYKNIKISKVWKCIRRFRQLHRLQPTSLKTKDWLKTEGIGFQRQHFEGKHWRRKVERFEKRLSLHAFQFTNDSCSTLTAAANVQLMVFFKLAASQLCLRAHTTWALNWIRIFLLIWKFLSNRYLCRAVWLYFHERSSLRQCDPMHLVKQFDTLIERGYQSWIY